MRLLQGGGGMMPTAEPSVAIGVCTALRPKMLASCLDAIAAQQALAGVSVHVVVVDNEPEPHNETLVRTFGARCPFSVHYVHEPRRGIPQARNAVLAKCRSLGVDWIAFTDDDCRVSPDWLASLLRAAARHEADVVYGRREFVAASDDPLPFWVAPSPSSCAEGQVLAFAATHNVLLKASLVRPDGEARLDFDERLAHGEDTDFFHRAACQGARIVYSHDPVVHETVPSGRATLSYQVRCAYHRAASRSYFHRRYGGVVSAGTRLAARWIFQVPLSSIRLSVAPLVWPFSEPIFKMLLLKGLGGLAGAVGATAGLLGCDGNPYGTIDGC